MFYKSAINVKNIGNDGVGTDFVQLEQLKATCGILCRLERSADNSSFFDVNVNAFTLVAVSCTVRAKYSARS